MLKLSLLRNSLNCGYQSSFGIFLLASLKNTLRVFDRPYQRHELSRTIENWYFDYLKIKYLSKGTHDKIRGITSTPYWYCVYFALDTLKDAKFDKVDVTVLTELLGRSSLHPLLENKLKKILQDPLHEYEMTHISPHDDPHVEPHEPLIK